ncbi:cAMP-dependent protein kinase type II regulatory subunit isoform X2 [Nematostella vectensis]|uniref:cAMP-dependent protein kinase type II regulatory subunit isoform X2 n=1 Tax=Nematostella vectensis TaxID=45351 RepID=UPI00138FAA80|nr:cAMP-dependent protein kinase type II regulatory subunit isoform X2 [Nematostella vectensis]
MAQRKGGLTRWQRLKQVFVFPCSRRKYSSASQSAPEPSEPDIEQSEIQNSPEPPKNRYARRQSVCAEPFHPDSEDEGDEQPIVYPKTDEQRQRLNDAIKNILLFKNLAKEQLNEVLDAMFERKTQAGDHIIDQGDDGDNFYVIDRGQYDIYVRIDGQEKMVGSYDNKGSFGELALMYNTPRAATIVSTSEGVIWGLDRMTFRRILLKAAAKKRKVHEALLETVPLLQEITEYERMNLADALVSRQFKDGECIIKQGDEADFMYFVESGTVSIRMHNKSDPTTEVEIAQCTKGGYFGELALITHNTRAASVYSVGDCVCASLDVHAFERLLGPCMDIMKRNIDGYEEQLQKLGVEHTELR